MIIHAGGRSSLIIAAALVAVVAFGLAGTGASYAADNGTMPLSADVPADGAAAPATADANTAPTDQQMTPAVPFPSAGNAVAENRNTTEAAATPDAPTNAVAASTDDSSGWDKASIIGKIFIACGTLLTLGSAARMFMI